MLTFSWYKADVFKQSVMMGELMTFTQSSPEAVAGSLPVTADSTDSTAAVAPM